MGSTSISQDKSFFLSVGVVKGSTTIRQRIDQRLNELGKKWADIYNKVGLNKAEASRIRNGLTIPPKWKRIDIAEKMQIDSSIIWEIGDIIANKIKIVGEDNQLNTNQEEENVSNNN